MKTRTKFVALLSAIAFFVLSLFGLSGALRAFADGEADAGSPDPDPGYAQLTSLYYFSDYSGSEEYFDNGFLRDYINWNPYITDAHLYYSGNYNGDYIPFWEMIGMMMAYGDMDIENAFIIFEVRGSLSKEPGIFTAPVTDEQIYEHYENSVYPTLEYLFAMWKGKGCKIMFISGTDEVWYEQDPMNKFLDYADIHINTDLLTTFTYSLVQISCTMYDFAEGVMILDGTMSQDWFFRKFLLPYIVSFYYENGIFLNIPPITEYDDYDDINVIQSILDELHLTVYFYENGGYTDIYGNTVNTDTVENKVYDSGYLCIIAEAESLLDENETLLNLYCAKGGNAEFFVFNLRCVPVEDIPSDIKYCGLSDEEMDYYLSAIMCDFILNDVPSLQKYDNWDGRCMVTFKPLFPGDGWLLGPNGCVLPGIL